MALLVCKSYSKASVYLLKENHDSCCLRLSSEVPDEIGQLLIQMALELEALKVTGLHTVLLLRLQVHLIVVLDALAGALGHQGGEVVEDSARLEVLNECVHICY